MPLSAAQFGQRVRFDRQIEGPPDEAGNPLLTWSPIVTVWANFKPQFGREAVEAGRLESTVKGVLTVRFSNMAATITAADRVVFLRSPYTDQAAQIRSITPMTNRREIEMTIELGVAL